ncbi:hypothetical protein NDU88_005465 [Pleurodeles waltl]|uniref:Uncharacterized protein n=1 Tax=Pleurodeles waltl TaxID=8319 RepID=A0AAV7TC39_PLEWA|nr:hypothetical protein NDU88_005465 [Pleurodeles waltl]
MVNMFRVQCGGVCASTSKESKDRCFRTRLQLERKPLRQRASPGKRRRQLERKPLHDVQESALPDAQVAAARVSRETETRILRAVMFGMGTIPHARISKGTETHHTRGIGACLQRDTERNS